jgi:hypothetical protein
MAIGEGEGFKWWVKVYRKQKAYNYGYLFIAVSSRYVLYYLSLSLLTVRKMLSSVTKYPCRRSKTMVSSRGVVRSE